MRVFFLPMLSSTLNKTLNDLLIFFQYLQKNNSYWKSPLVDLTDKSFATIMPEGVLKAI